MKTSEPKPRRACSKCGGQMRHRSTLITLCYSCARAAIWGNDKSKPGRKPTPAYKLTRPVSRHGVTVPNVDIAKGNHRDRKLLDLAHEVHECTNCGALVVHGCDPCHENGIEAGKGQSIKSQDHRHFAGCGTCHAWYDSGKGPSPCGQWAEHEKPQMFDRSHKRTFDIYWRNGWLRVAA